MLAKATVPQKRDKRGQIKVPDSMDGREASVLAQGLTVISEALGGFAVNVNDGGGDCVGGFFP